MLVFVVIFPCHFILKVKIAKKGIGYLSMWLLHMFIFRQNSLGKLYVVTVVLSYLYEGKMFIKCFMPKHTVMPAYKKDPVTEVCTP